MKIVNVEFKARVKDLDSLEQRLTGLQPVFIGEDRQVDTYFSTPKGRLKLREGKIENALIYYDREDIPGIKRSNILLYQHQPDQALKNILAALFGVKVVVSKNRKIYFIENVKFHFDTVDRLGTFIEVEAIDTAGKAGEERLQKQCDGYFSFFNLNKSDLAGDSYSDMLLEESYSPR